MGGRGLLWEGISGGAEEIRVQDILEMSFFGTKVYLGTGNIFSSNWFNRS